MDQLTHQIKDHPTQLYYLKNKLEEKQFLIVPEGLGGQIIGKLQTISATSPIGQKLVSAKTGNLITIGETQWTLQ